MKMHIKISCSVGKANEFDNVEQITITKDGNLKNVTIKTDTDEQTISFTSDRVVIKVDD